MQKKYKIVVLGPAASGKGTQVEFLTEKLNLPNISTGQLLRDEIEKKTQTGKEAEEYMRKGELVPNAFVNELVKQRLNQSDTQNGFIFDGFPRIRIQAKYLNTLTDITNVIHIKVSDAEVKNRLSGRRTCPKCGNVYHLKFNPPKNNELCDDCKTKLEIRDDDTEAGINKRLEIYHKETEEVVDYYKEKNILIEINGEQSIQDVRKEIFRKLKI